MDPLLGQVVPPVEVIEHRGLLQPSRQPEGISIAEIRRLPEAGQLWGRPGPDQHSAGRILPGLPRPQAGHMETKLGESATGLGVVGYKALHLYNRPFVIPAQGLIDRAGGL